MNFASINVKKIAAGSVERYIIMEHLYVYYRALRNYLALTSENRDCLAYRRAFASNDADNDSILITRNICTVDENWIIEIEKGLIFIENAIKEERQFIYSNGEVVPIEKVKHISRDSVQHLAKHSNLISKEHEGDDIIPDHLYSVERLNDYAVYENRFLYMLLCYLRDFVTIRYDKILELSNKYEGSLKLDKEISLPNQNISYTVSLHHEKKNDAVLRENNPSKSVIERIDLILKTIVAFLSTPLMEIAGKAPKLKPPITKTNVLKMDKHFKGAVALYDYIIAYDKPGYEFEVKTEELAPFGEDLAGELSEAGALLAFLTYEYGLDLNDRLKSNFALEEERKKIEEIKQREERLAKLRRKLENMEISPEDYILEAEKLIKLLQNDNRQIESLRNQIIELKESEMALNSALALKTEEADRLNRELSDIEDRHFREKEQMKAEFDEITHKNLLKHEEEMKMLEKSFNAHIADMTAKARAESEALNEAIYGLRTELGERDAKINELTESEKKLTEEKLVCEARINALRSINGESISDDEFTEKESFDELERELDAFVAFYEQRWSITKKKIRKKLLNYQTLKGQNGQNGKP